MNGFGVGEAAGEACATVVLVTGVAGVSASANEVLANTTVAAIKAMRESSVDTFKDLPFNWGVLETHPILSGFH